MLWLRRAVQTWADYWYAGWWEFTSLFSRRPPAGWSRGELAPVLLLPGVYEPWRFLRRAGRRLNAAGHPVHAVLAIRYNVDTIADVAALAQRYLETHDLNAVVLVAHSKGGLVGKHMMAVDDTHGRIDRLVAVATPFSGSSMARFMPVRTLRAFMPTDVTISSLAANLALNSRITSIFGEFDPHIPGGSRLEGATNIPLPIVGHFRLLVDERVLRAIENAAEGKN